MPICLFGVDLLLHFYVTNKPWQSVSQLRLLSPGQQDLQKICQMALHYEKNAFETQPDKVGHVQCHGSKYLTNLSRKII